MGGGGGGNTKKKKISLTTKLDVQLLLVCHHNDDSCLSKKCNVIFSSEVFFPQCVTTSGGIEHKTVQIERKNDRHEYCNLVLNRTTGIITMEILAVVLTHQ